MLCWVDSKDSLCSRPSIEQLCYAEGVCGRIRCSKCVAIIELAGVSTWQLTPIARERGVGEGKYFVDKF